MVIVPASFGISSQPRQHDPSCGKRHGQRIAGAWRVRGQPRTLSLCRRIRVEFLSSRRRGGRLVHAGIEGADIGQAAAATAVFSSDVRSKFTITSLPTHITDIKINTPFSRITGDGSVDTDIVSGADVHPVEVHSKVSGSASASTHLASSAAALRGHLVEIDRATPPPPDSPPTVTVEFLFEVFWTFDLAVGMPFLESADAGAYFAIAGFEDGETLAVLSGPGAYGVGGDGNLLWEFDPFASIMFGAASVSGSAEIRGTITVDSGVVGAFSVITDAAGSAHARPVPEPAGWVLVALALGLLATRGCLRISSRR